MSTRPDWCSLRSALSSACTSTSVASDGEASSDLAEPTRRLEFDSNTNASEAAALAAIMAAEDDESLEILLKLRELKCQRLQVGCSAAHTAHVMCACAHSFPCDITLVPSTPSMRTVPCALPSQALAASRRVFASQGFHES